ncbi:MAG: 6-bladed beta-propeller [Tannerellaceae bacterium]
MKNIFLAASVLMLCSCASESSQSGITTVNVASGIKDAKALATSSLFDKVEYIPLETTDESIISKIADIRVMDDYILMSSSGLPMKLFDRKTGKFIREIGKLGNGPEEYSSSGGMPVIMYVDAGDQTIYVASQNKELQHYDVKGNYLGKIVLPDNVKKYPGNNHFYIDGGNVLTHSRSYLSNCPWETARFSAQTSAEADTTAQIHSRKACDMSQIESISAWHNEYTKLGGVGAILATMKDGGRFEIVPESPSIWKMDDAYRLKGLDVDTIYNIVDNTFVPHLAFDLGEWQCTYDEAFQTEALKSKIKIDFVLENDDYLYLRMHKGLRPREDVVEYCGFYDKKNKTTHVTDTDKLRDEAVGTDLRIRNISPKGEFVALLYPHEIEGVKINGNLIGDEDNPVVVIMQ